MVIVDQPSIRSYEILNIIGQGANGVVYRARQPVINREVAIKFILPEYANHPDFIRRFEAEAQLVAQLEHFHIVQLYDYWRDPQGAYLVMRLMKGGSLAELLENGEPWEVEMASRLVDQISSALDAAHQQGVVHRDLKPANILLDEDRNAYLSDFGIAKELGESANVTLTGSILGTPAYIAPEQVQGFEVSAQTDIYALGVMLFELLTGEHPFPNTSTAELVVKHLQEPLPYVRESLPYLPAAVDGIIQRATAKNPSERYSSASEMAGDLRRALQLDVGVAEVPIDELVNPYKGLRAFQESDREDFFGREALTGQLLAHLANPGIEGRFMAVIGPSGSGKSSLVKAGLLPALRKGALPGSGQWFILEMTPGVQPLNELALALLSISANPELKFHHLLDQDRYGIAKSISAAVPGVNEQLLLVIDQFEELFSLVQDEDQQSHFLESLYSAVTDQEVNLRVVIALRADFYDRPLMHPHFGRLVEENTMVVLPLSPEELDMVIRNPAERVGAVLEKGLVSAITTDVADQPGSLPLLQYALTELFERRDGRMLTCAAYQSIGGVLGALSRRSEEVYTELDDLAKNAARQLFLRLVTLGEGAEDTRRRVVRSEIVSVHPELMPQVIEAFGKARLLTFDHDPDTRAPTVEVAHEALLREWQRLRSWLDNSRADIRMQRVLANAAFEWQTTDRDPGYLLRDSRLNQFEAWSATTDLVLTRIEQDYLDASLAERRARQEEEKQRQARETAMEHRSRNFLRGLVGVLAVATVVAVALSMFALSARNQAQTEADARATQQVIAESEAEMRATQQSIAESEADQRATQQAVAEEQAAARATAESIAIEQRDQVLRQASVSLSEQALEQKDLGNPELAVLLAMAALDEFPYMPQAEEALGKSVEAISSSRLIPEGGNLGWSAVAWSPVDDRIATGLFGGTIPGSEILIQDAASAEEILRIPIDADCPLASNIIWSPSGDRLIAIPRYCEYSPRIWDSRTGELIASLNSEPGQANFSAAWSPEGESILTGSQDGIARMWDAGSGKLIGEIHAHDNYINQVAWSPTGDMLATASSDDTAKIWHSENGELILVIDGFSDDVAGLAWSPDGRKIVVTSLDSSADVWDATTLGRLFSLPDHNDQVWDVAWSPDGKYIATDSRDGITIIWDAASGKNLRDFQNNLEEQLVLNSIDWSPDGDRLLIMGAAYNQIWDLATLPPKLSGHSRGLSAAQYSPDEDFIATAGLDSTAGIWDASSGELLAALEHAGAVTDLSWSPDSSQLAAASQEGSIRIWDVHTHTFDELPNPDQIVFNSLVWSPDGTRIVASSEVDPVAVIWDLNSGEMIILEQGDLICALASPSWSPAGDQMVTGCERGDLKDTPARIWDAETGQELNRLLSDDGNSLTVDWSPDGNSIAVGYSDMDILIWDSASGQPINKYSKHSDLIADLAWSPNSQRIVSADYGGHINVWDAQTAQEIYSRKITSTINSVNWSPNGAYVITATFDPIPEIQRAWQSTEALLEYAKRCCVWRDLTPAERQRFALLQQ